MIKYNIVIHYYDTVLVNVAAYVIPIPVYSAPHTHTHTHTHTHANTSTNLTRNYICGHIYKGFVITSHYYIVFII
jgi:hypothetical protein